MAENNGEKKEKKGFFSRLLDKLDKKMGEKAKEGKCCGGSDDKNKGKSCCG